MQLLLGDFVKQSTCLLQLLLGTSLKAEWPSYTLQLLLGPLWRESTELWCGSEMPWVGPQKLVGRQVPLLPSFKHTTVYNPDNDLMRESEPTEHVLLHPICVLSHLMCACKHCNKPYHYIIEHIEISDEFITSKQPDLTLFFITQPRHLGRLKSRYRWKKLSGSPGHMRQNATAVTWSEHLKIYCRVIVTQKKTRVQQSASKFLNLPLQAKDWTWVNYAVVLSVSWASRYLSAPNYMPSCIHPESDFHLIRCTTMYYV